MGNPSPNPLLLGRRNAADGRVLATKALLDEVAFWNHALSDSEVRALYNKGMGLSLR